MVCIEICRWETKESGGLQSMGLQRVGCDCYWECTGTHTHTIIAPKSFVSHLHISCEGFAPWEIAKFWTKPDAEENFNSLTEELPPNGHPWWSCGKESAYNAGDLGLMPPEPAMRPSPPSPLPQSSSVSFTSESTSRHLWSFVVFPKCNFSPFSRSCINILKALWVFL